MECLGEEIIDGDGNIAESKQQEDDEISSSDLPTDSQQIDPSLVELKSGGGDRKLSFESQTSISVAPPKSPRHSKSRNSLSSRGWFYDWHNCMYFFLCKNCIK